MPISLRSVAEKLSRGIVLKRRLPSAFGRLPIYVSPEAALRYWLPLPKTDPMLYRMAKELVSPGNVVWDIGANVGLFSMCAAALAGPSGSVLAIEPDPWLCSLINQSARSSPAPVSTLCAAASSRSGVAELEISERSRAANHLVEAHGSSQSCGRRGIQAVACVTLDSLLDRAQRLPSVLKIDVETHELDVLLGARRVLDVAHPSIWCEVSPENSHAVFGLLRQHGYTLFAAAEACPRSPLTRRASWDTLAVPA